MPSSHFRDPSNSGHPPHGEGIFPWNFNAGCIVNFLTAINCTTHAFRKFDDPALLCPRIAPFINGCPASTHANLLENPPLFGFMAVNLVEFMDFVNHLSFRALYRPCAARNSQSFHSENRNWIYLKFHACR
jgi:hypothetical protein